MANDSRSEFFNVNNMINGRPYENASFALGQSKLADLKRRNSINLKTSNFESPMLVRRSESFRSNESPFKNKMKQSNSISNSSSNNPSKNVYEVIFGII